MQLLLLYKCVNTSVIELLITGTVSLHLVLILALITRLRGVTKHRSMRTALKCDEIWHTGCDEQAEESGRHVLLVMHTFQCGAVFRDDKKTPHHVHHTVVSMDHTYHMYKVCPFGPYRKLVVN